MAPSDDLWPDDAFTQLSEPTPKQLIRETAAALTDRTGGVLRGEVETTPSDYGRFNHQMYVAVPALDYRMLLFTVKHKTSELYPADLWSPTLRQEQSAANHEELRVLIKAFLAQADSRRLISTLFTQATSD